MNNLYKSLVVSFVLIFPSLFVNAQSSALLKFNQTEKLKAHSSFSIIEVLDGRKDSLNNGFTLISKKKTKVEFEGSTANQLAQYLTPDLTNINSELLPVVIRISKLMLTERPSSKGTIVKTDLTIQFLRKDHGELIQLNEAGSWIEQAAMNNALKLHEKNIKDLLNRMLTQFDKLVNEQKENPLFAHHIEFKVIHATDEQKDGDTIFWDKEIKLTWDDFKGKPGTGEFAAQSNCAFAQSITPKVENGKGMFYINARAAFFKGTSWVKKENMNAEILAHEQLHFDIAEWQIRTLRKTLMESDLSFNHYSEIINRLYDAAWHKYSLVQDAYDNETIHGTIADEQERWSKKVAEALIELKEY